MCDKDLTVLGNRLNSLINLIHIVWVEMGFSLENHLLKNCLGNDIHTTTSIYHQLKFFPRV